MEQTLKGLVFAGSGGQGVILCSIILAAAALSSGGYVAQSQSYGPEARGGTCKAEVVISDQPIDFPKSPKCDFLLALTQAALNKYLPLAKPGATVMIDDSLTPPEDASDIKLVSLPILSTASNVLGKPMVANIIAAGAINAHLGLASEQDLEAAVMQRVPKGTEELNRKALLEGIKIAKN